MKDKHPAIRWSLFGLGVLLLIGAAFVGPIPGPGGIFLFAGGMTLILQTSPWAKRLFARFKRRWPRIGHYADLSLRRASARRRRERDKQRALAEEQGRTPN